MEKRNQGYQNNLALMQITLFFFYFLLGFNLSLTLLQATTGIFPISFIFQQTYLMQYMYVYVYIYKYIFI